MRDSQWEFSTFNAPGLGDNGTLSVRAATLGGCTGIKAQIRALPAPATPGILGLRFPPPTHSCPFWWPCAKGLSMAIWDWEGPVLTTSSYDAATVLSS